MGFLAFILWSLFVGIFSRMLRGCLMCLIGICAFGWLLRHDHATLKTLCDQVEVLAHQAGKLLNEH